jgi:hypothetical protein
MMGFLFVMSGEQSENIEKFLRRLNAEDAARTEKRILVTLLGVRMLGISIYVALHTYGHMGGVVIVKWLLLEQQYEQCVTSQYQTISYSASSTVHT